MRIALDADVCIYGITQSQWTRAVRQRMAGATLIGSVLLPVELLPKPKRTGADAELFALLALLRRVELVEITVAVAALATEMAAEHGLRALDATHLATAAHAGADVFFTNNHRDFGRVRVDGLAIEFPAIG